MKKTIIISDLDLTNFKGIRNLHVDFSDDLTTIYGKNGSGKTTIFDAFTWVMFGKDSHDSKVFSIKTLDADNQPIPDIPHEVKCTLLVNGEPVEIMRSYIEDWTKKRGSSERVFTGHTESRFYNGVPCSVKDFSAKIAELCDESVFKFITNPLYFTAQKPDVQREMLFRMAGDVSDAEVVEGNADFQELLGKLTGKTLEEYKREIASRKRRIKDEIDGIPARIDERKRQVPVEENWKALEGELKTKVAEVEGIEAKLYDVNEALRQQAEQKKALYAEVNDTNRAISDRTLEVQKAVFADYNKAVGERNEILQAITGKEQQISRKEGELQDFIARRDQYNKQREILLGEWKSIKAETLTFDDNQFTCPTCGRKYEVDEIQARQSEMIDKFNQNKAAKLEANKQKGLLIKQTLENLSADITRLEGEICDLKLALQTLKANDILRQEPQRPSIEGVLDEDKVIIELKNKVVDLQNRISSSVEPGDETAALRAQKQVVSSEIDAIKSRLSKREIIAQNNKRIAELEKELQEQSQELALLEGMEFTIAAFGKEKVSRIESRINGMFSIVRFKMFRQQINGGEEATCEAMVDGVPFSDLNNAMKVNAGLDIINAICRSEEVYAPIFVDNAESVNNLTQTQSQMVRLVVTDDETLIIE